MIKGYTSNNGQRLVFVGVACVGVYLAFRYYSKRELKTIDEGFDETAKIDDTHDKRILLLGLDNAGKTSFMNQATLAGGSGEPFTIPPVSTNGFAVYKLEHKVYTLNVWEIGGSENTRKYWSNFLQDTDLLLFMVDASNTAKLSLAVSILKELLGDSRMDNVPILVIANKQDVPKALKPDQVKEALDLRSIPRSKHKVEVIGCQTRPIPQLQGKERKYNCFHPSVDVVRRKILSMAIAS